MAKLESLMFYFSILFIDQWLKINVAWNKKRLMIAGRTKKGKKMEEEKT